MQPFLQSVAQRIFTDNNGQLRDVTVVFNNRRAGLFLQEHFKSLSNKPFFLPKIIGIDDVVQQLGGLHIVPHEFLLFELYDIHRNLEGIEQRFATFEEFMPFGEMLLGDFSEIDLYRADAASLFENLHELKQLGEWDISGQPLTSFQQKYLNFFRSLHHYYEQFRQRLLAQQQAYTGMAYRHVADNIDRLAEKIECRHLYFVGFNAISDSEATIIGHFVRQGMATLICDGDDYYASDSRQEAGLFLRKNALRFPGIGPFEAYYANSPKTIHIVNCPENTLQAKAMGEILDRLAPSSDDNAKQDCAIVLADEQLLLPVLNSLPPQVRSTNITMGFPFVLSNAHGLNSKLLSLYSNVRNGRFYHRDVVAVLSDDLIGKRLSNKEMLPTMTHKVNKTKTIYASKEEIADWMGGIAGGDSLMFLFDNSKPSVGQTLTLLEQTTSLVANSTKLTTAELESLACSLQVINYLKQLEAIHGCMDTLSTLQRIYQRIAQRRTISFYGEPLHGLQVLGMLETRSLDFSRVILLSLNEGILPSGRNDNTLIPLALKKAFGLPTYEEKDAVFAYNFYRLLQRSDEAWLLYSSFAEGLGKGEPSRFILQLKNELSAKHKNIRIVEHIVQARNTSPQNVTDSGETIQKNEQTIRRLHVLAERGLSPSALNRYRSCPKQFFLTYILGVNEQDEVSEQLESNELGTFIHSVLCDIYNRDKDKIIRPETLRQSLDSLDKVVGLRYRYEVLQGRDPEGKNHIYGEVAKMQLRHFLEKEIDLLEQGHIIEMVLTEDEMKLPLTIMCEEGPDLVFVKGVTDRVDRFDGTLRIADYKSGEVNPADLTVKEPEPDPMLVPEKWFQVMTYAWLYCKKHSISDNFTSGIFPLRALGADFMPASWQGTSRLNNSHIQQFGQLLVSLLTEIYNPTVPFRTTPSKEACRNCPFINSCTSAKN